MQRARIFQRGILEDQATEVAVSGDDVVRLLFLAEFVTVVWLTSSVVSLMRLEVTKLLHSIKAPTEYASNAQHMNKKENIVLRLEDKHIVESSRYRGASHQKNSCPKDIPGKQQ